MDQTSNTQDVNVPAEPVVENPVTPEQTANTNAPDETPAVEEKPNEWDARFSKLSKRESKLINWEKKLKDSQQNLTEYNQIKELAKSNPSAVLEQLGISWDDLVSAQIERTEAEQKDPTQKALDEIKAEQAKIQEDIKTREKRELEAQQANTRAQVENSLMASFEEGKADLKFLSRLPEEKLKGELFEAAVEMHKQTGKVPTSGEVCKLLESIYEDQYKPFADIYNPPKENPEEPQLEENTNIPGLKTTSPFSSSQQTPNKEPDGMLTDEERKQRAIKALDALGY